MKPLRINCFMHASFEGPGFIGDWALKYGHKLQQTRFFEKQPLPDPAEWDLLIVMGGPMGVCDEEKFPFLSGEKKFIREWMLSGKPVLGICLGAQLLAHAAGAPVVANRWKEIGWYPLTPTPAGQQHPLLKDADWSVPVFHWHGDTFAIPATATHLLRSEACINQAFLLGKKALGLQFHLEMTKESLEGMLQHCSSDLTDERYVQHAETLLSGTGVLESNHRLLECFLNYLIEI